MLWPALISSKTAQLGAEPIAGHSVYGAVTGFAADAVPAARRRHGDVAVIAHGASDARAEP